MKQLTFLLLTLAALLVAACDGSKCEGDTCNAITMETATAALNASENVKTNLTDLGEMIAFLEESHLVLEMFGMFAETNTVCAPSPDDEAGVEPECWDETVDTEVDTDMSQMAEDIATWLEENVFTDSQLESSGSTLVYLLDPTTFCAMDREDESDNQECVDLLTQVPIRIRVTSYSQGDLELDILFGAEKLDPVDLQLHTDKLGLEINLGVARDVAQLYLDSVESSDLEADLPSTFKGKVAMALTRVSQNQFELTYSVKEKVEFGMTVDGDEFAVTLGKSTLTLLADKTTKALSFDAKIGALDVTFPYQAFVNAMWDSGGEEERGDGETSPPDEKPVEPPYDDIVDGEAPIVSGTASLHIAGLTGAAAFAASDETLTFSGLGLGNSAATFKRNDTTLLSVSLSTFDLEVSANDDDLLVTVAPKFDLALTMALAAIADDLEELPEFMADDTLSATFDGAAKPTLKFVEDAIMVVDGTLTLASVAYPEDSIIVTTGQCLHGESDAEDGPETGEEPTEDPLPEEGSEGHDLLSTLYAGDCQ
jgi:hypothetical protein